MPRGRPSIGAAAKTKVIAIRVTEAEEAELKAVYGTAAKGLRALLNASKRNKPPQPER
jgi:hypothetical protein